MQRRSYDRSQRAAALMVLAMALVAASTTGAQPANHIAEVHATIVASTPLTRAHQTIVLDEDAYAKERAQTAFAQPVSFAQLASWTGNAADAIPTQIAALNDKAVAMVGFMRLIATSPSSSTFWLLPSTEICCWGPLPPINRRVLVEFDEPVPTVRYHSTQVAGQFYVDTRPNHDFTYRIKAYSVADHDRAIVTWPPDAEACRTSAVHFPWPAFIKAAQAIYAAEAVASFSVASLPASITALVGGLVVVDGYMVRPPTEAGHAANNPWRIGHYEQECHFVQAVPANSMTLHLDRFQPDYAVLKRGTFVGKLRLNPTSAWDSAGIFELDDAMLVAFDRLNAD